MTNYNKQKWANGMEEESPIVLPPPQHPRTKGHKKRSAMELKCRSVYERGWKLFVVTFFMFFHPISDSSFHRI